MRSEELMLAIQDDTYAEKIRVTRISTPAERDAESRLQRIRKKMEAAGALNEETSKGKKNLARLTLAMDSIPELIKLEEAWLDEADNFRLGNWPVGKTFIVHEEAVLITQFLLQYYRLDIRRFRIAVIMQKGIPPVNRRGRLGTSAKLPGKIKYLSEYDAVITLDFEHWRNLTDKDRQRLIHHELAHLSLNEDGDGLCIRTHDFEDFAAVVDLYGLRSESEKFSTDGDSAEVLERWGSQLELLKTA